MQQITDQLMTKQDFITLLEKMNSIEAMIKAQQPQDQTDLVWRNAKDVANGLNNGKGIPLSTARSLIAMPNFPKNIHGKRGRNKTGPWRASEVIQFFKINKNKV